MTLEPPRTLPRGTGAMPPVDKNDLVCGTVWNFQSNSEPLREFHQHGISNGMFVIRAFYYYLYIERFMCLRTREDIILSTRFKQQHFETLIFRKAWSNHTARWTATNYDKVVFGE